jgi:hypothetical protein
LPSRSALVSLSSQVIRRKLPALCWRYSAWLRRSFHTNFADPNQTFHFIKNLVMTGGLIQIVAAGAGAISIDNRHAKHRARTGDSARAGERRSASDQGSFGGNSVASIQRPLLEESSSFAWTAVTPSLRRKFVVAMVCALVFENLNMYEATTHFNRQNPVTGTAVRSGPRRSLMIASIRFQRQNSRAYFTTDHCSG